MRERVGLLLSCGFTYVSSPIDFLNAPPMIHDAGFHRRRDAERLMHPSEIVEHGEEGQISDLSRLPRVRKEPGSVNYGTFRKSSKATPGNFHANHADRPVRRYPSSRWRTRKDSGILRPHQPSLASPTLIFLIS